MFINKKFGVAFDLEGTIVDVEAAHHQAHLKIAQELGLKLTIPEAIEKIEHFIGGPDDLIMSEILKLANKNGDIKQLSQEDKKLYREFLSTTRIETRAGFEKCLEDFKKYGAIFAVGSLTEHNEARILIERSGLDKLIPLNNIVYREDVKNLKPSPDVFIETAKRLRLDTSQQIVFEDSPRGVIAAIAAGSKIVIGMPVYDTPVTRKSLIEAGARHIFKSWKEVDVGAIIKELS